MWPACTRATSVAVLGVPVGRIEKIERKGSYVEVTMSIDKNVKVPADAIAARCRRS